MDSEIIKNITKNSEKFSIDLYKNFAEEKNENFTISPFGVYLLSAIATYSASDETREELRKTLGLSKDDTENFQGFQTLVYFLSNITRGIQLSIANKLVVSDTLNVKPDFKDTLQQHFRSDCEVFDFSKAEETVKSINDWCGEKIQDDNAEIISIDDLSDPSSALLLNTVYFKGEWEDQFLHEYTENKPFHVDENNQIELPMMRMDRETFQYGVLEDLDAKFVRLPYKFPSFEMVIIVPNQITGLSQLEKNVDKLTCDRIDECSKAAYVNLFLPRFKIENTIDLREHLDKMGLTKMFSDSAEFHNMAEEPVKIRKCIQKTVIVVDEGGPKREIQFEDMLKKLKYMKEVNINADRPFLTMLVYKNLPLFYSKFTGRGTITSDKIC